MPARPVSSHAGTDIDRASASWLRERARTRNRAYSRVEVGDRERLAVYVSCEDAKAFY